MALLIPLSIRQHQSCHWIGVVSVFQLLLLLHSQSLQAEIAGGECSYEDGAPSYLLLAHVINCFASAKWFMQEHSQSGVSRLCYTAADVL